MWPTYNERLSDPRRCSARRQRDGKPCGRYAIRGGTVCPLHGGKAPQVLRKAVLRKDHEQDLANMRAIVRRVYQGDYSARPDPPEVIDAEPVAEEPPVPPPASQPRLPVPEHIEVPPDSTPSHAEGDDPSDTVPAAFAEPSGPPSAPGLQTLEEAVTSARVVRVRRVR
jgi:hypothetical protein